MACRKWWSGGVCKSKITLENKLVIITGCNTGIGKETARDLAARGAHVIMACRDVKKGEAAVDEIRKENPQSMITVYQLNLASFRSIRTFAEKVLENESQIHILINNAGVMMCPYGETEDGFELHFGTNHLGHFLLTCLLLDRMKNSAPARIINVSSLAHKWGKMHWKDLNMKKRYHRFASYCQSKLANVLFTKELAERLQGTGVTVYAVHPGVVHTELGRHITIRNKMMNVLIDRASHLVLKTPVQGAQTTIYCAVAEELANESGLYYGDCAKKMPCTLAQDSELARRLWDESMAMVQIQKAMD